MTTDALPLVRHTLRRTRTGVIGWSLGLVASALLYLPLYPSMGASGELDAVVTSLPPDLVSALNLGAISTGAGYAQATLFGLLGFVLLTLAAVGWGAAAIGGEEESGALELTLAHGVTRVQVALEAALALAVRLLVCCAVLSVTVLALAGPSELGLSPGGVLAGTCALYLLSLLAGLAAVTVGALTGSRTASIAGGAAVAVLGYVLNALGNQAEATGWMRGISPYHWVFGADPLATGPSPEVLGDLAVTLGGCGVLVLVAAVGLSRRDIGR